MSLFEKNELKEYNEADWEENIFKRICHSRLFTMKQYLPGSQKSADCPYQTQKD